MIDSNIFRGSLFALIGLSFYIYLFIRKLRIRKHSGTVKATITHVCRMGIKGTVYQPVYEFCAEGRMYKVKSRFGYPTSVTRDGDMVDLYFIPGQPEKIYVPREDKRSLPLILFLYIVGLIFVVAGLAVAAGCLQ